MTLTDFYFCFYFCFEIYFVICSDFCFDYAMMNHFDFDSFSFDHDYRCDFVYDSCFGSYFYSDFDFYYSSFAHYDFDFDYVNVMSVMGNDDE